MNPEICPSALEEDGTLDRSNGEDWGKHKWDETTNPITCSECGTTKTITTEGVHIEAVKCDVRDCLADATINRCEVWMEYDIVDGEYIQPGRVMNSDGASEHYCDVHA